MDATLRTEDGRYVLRLERFLAHPPGKVWRAVTEPAHLAGWFPAAVAMTPRLGETITFAPDAAAPDGTGVITELDEPRVFAFTWNGDAFRIELLPADGGCVLVFTHTFGPDDRVNAGSFAAGWESCLEALAAGLDGTPAPEMTMEAYAARHEEYQERFALLRGTAGPDGTVRIERLYPYHHGVWGEITEGAEPKPGDPPPVRFTNGYVPAGAVTSVGHDGALAYASGAGEVRWRVRPVPQGTRVTITQTKPEDPALALAAWHVQLEVFGAHLRGEEVCPWPADRTEELRRAYAEAHATR